MRTVILLIGLFILAPAVVAPAYAQRVAVDCTPAAAIGRVNVETTSDGTIRGTLLCLSSDEVTVLRNGEVIKAPLAAVRRIARPADPVWDGAVKGAAVVMTMWGIACGFCSDGAGIMARSAAGYALLGMSIDAMQTNRRTIYVGGTTPSLKVRLSF